MAEKFSLKWNDFDTNTTKAFGLLRNEDFLKDVTLVGDDNHQVAAHKLVLSACSEYFKTIFKSNKYPNLLLCLEGMSSSDISNILDYIYNGEVKIFQDDLERFLAVAQRFKLKGLLGGDSQHEEVEEEKQNDIIQPKLRKASLKREYTEINNRLQQSKVKEMNSTREIATTMENENIKMAMTEEEKNNLDDKIHQHVEKTNDGLYQCNLCGKSAKQKIQIKYHIEAKHLEGIQIPCPICGKIFRSHNGLFTHKSRYHFSI